MAKNRKKFAESALADESGGLLSGFLADEGAFDRRILWRLGSWGIGSIAAMTIAILAHQSGNGLRTEPRASFQQGQIAEADLARQSQQLRSLAKTSEHEISRISSAISTLNDDRDRLFARVTALEQGLDSVTGSISQNVEQNARAPSRTEASLDSPPVEAPLLPPPDFALRAKRHDPPTKSVASNSRSANGEASGDVHPSAPTAFAAAAETTPANPSSVPAIPLSGNSPPSPALPATARSAPKATPDTLQVASRPAIVAQNLPATSAGGPDETASVTPKTTEPKEYREPHKDMDAERKDAQIVVASIPAAIDAPQQPSPAQNPVAHTDFGVDLGSANSIKGLRALWRSVLKSEPNELTSLQPIIVVKERSNGIGMQLRLVAGPLDDAAAAAKICAVLSESGRACETAVFEGQRLATNEEGKESGNVVTAKKPRGAHASSRHRHNGSNGSNGSNGRPVRAEEPAPTPPPAPPPPPNPSTSSSFFSH